MIMFSRSAPVASLNLTKSTYLLKQSLVDRVPNTSGRSRDTVPYWGILLRRTLAHSVG